MGRMSGPANASALPGEKPIYPLGGARLITSDAGPTGGRLRRDRRAPGSEFIPAAKEALTSLIAEQTHKKLIRCFNWAGRNSLFPLHWGLACCAIEFAAAFGARWDAERFGVVPRSSPRQCDLLIVNGTVTWKVAHKLITLYEQMPEPKWVIAMGNCATGGGPFRTVYSVVPGVDKLVPVDVYIAGCPPRPEALLDGILKLEELIKERGE